MTNWPMALLMLLVTLGAVYVGKLWFHRLFNPLSIYSATWGFCLINYELRLIQYYEITPISWIYIFVAWVSLYLGAGIVLLATGRERKRPSCNGRDLTRLRKAILILSVFGSIGLMGQLFAIWRQFGNPLIALIIRPGEIYGARLSNELSGISYVGAFTFAACTLAGIYTAKVGRLTRIASLPLILVALQLLSVMGRTGLGIAGVLFVAAFIYTPGTVRIIIPFWQRIIGAALALILVASFFIISAVRHLDVNFAGITPRMEQISQYVPFFPSLYSNFSATPVAFSLYLETPEQEKQGFWGMYTFGPIFRILSHVGFRFEVPAHEENYFTPVPMNTSTYLKNIYSDFGPSGVVLFPFLLGASVTSLIVRANSTAQTLTITVLANLFVLIVFAFAFDFMVLGDWYIGFGSGVLAAAVVDLT